MKFNVDHDPKQGCLDIEASNFAAEATIDIYFTNSVGIGEHPQHLEEMDKQVKIIASAEDNLDVLHAYFGDTGEDKE